MKTDKKLYELYDIDGKMTITYNWRDVKEMFKHGFVCYFKILFYRVIQINTQKLLLLL
jgi:hypothetical protein